HLISPTAPGNAPGPVGGGVEPPTLLPGWGASAIPGRVRQPAGVIPMASTVTVTLGQLVDRALQEIQSYNEIGKAVVRYEGWSATDTTCTLSEPEKVNVSDVIEFGSELVLVSGKSQ